ncbi:hypothetical protein Q4485_14195 [Granulosicoccaceae sp. 1_MG-2023]|nr:hypothetical protein [Granulosicoccaceae sp. 1_MG-2023]
MKLHQTAVRRALCPSHDQPGLHGDSKIAMLRPSHFRRSVLDSRGPVLRCFCLTAGVLKLIFSRLRRRDLRRTNSVRTDFYLHTSGSVI